ncbi:cytoplasmic dynein 2 intermediate chain 1 isoform X2 [Phymastichus coffea]|uniref:cytoplasmic dynein 2 intermediate chain 1 isoform X2 n=1 Tax=Phymastichus coffea TaxID=108790 RepID=UPI00273B0D7F|nr:cytoplasmic dynein 2 intermediate chain 1 isoform X2 [Phymastichus coffea]
MSSVKGAIKKTATDAKRDGTPLKVKPRVASKDNTDEKVEKKKREQLQTAASGDKNINRTATSSSLSNKSILPDKNPMKLRQLKQNGLLLSSKSSLDEPSTKTVTGLKKPKKPAASDATKTSSVEKTKITVRKSTKDKVQAQYSEKRGESTLYVPKSTASKLNSKPSTDKDSTRKSTEKIKNSKTVEIAVKSKSSDKPLPRKASRERRKSRTLSPSEVKVLHSTKQRGTVKSRKRGEEIVANEVVAKLEDEMSVEVEEEFPAEVEDESTADSEDEASAAAAIGVEDQSKLDDDGEMYIYEEDFEEYESDFESYSGTPIGEVSDNNSILSIDLESIILHSSDQKPKTVNGAEVRRTEEENMLDSGHYELTEARKRAALVESLMSVQLQSPSIQSKPRQAKNQPYRQEKHLETKSLPSSTDEGFEDAGSGDFVKSPPLSQISLSNQEKPKQKEVKKKALTRGQILMSMIKLDSVGWSLYESQPISYDEYIRSYGKLNAQQASTQTNEDNVDVEIQTDTSELENKWTQFPVKCRRNLKSNEDVKLFKIEHTGVGGDNTENIQTTNPIYDVLRLNEFFNRAGKVMLALLEEKEYGGNILQNETRDFPFSEGFIKLSVNSLSFLADRQVVMLHYSEVNNKILVSVHAASMKEDTETLNKQDYIMECCIGCVWNVNEPSRPTKLFYSQNSITAFCFHCTNNNIIFAGLQDGSICVWDLREDETHHQKIIDKVNEVECVVRSPTYTTAGNWEIECHLCPVIAIRILSKVDQEDTESLNDKFVSIQICSLDDEGHLIIWSVLRNLSVNLDDLGLTPWGKVKLVKSQEVPLFFKVNEAKREFVDMQVDSADSNNLYLATNNTEILHANSIGGKSNKSCYRINQMDSCGSTTCIEVCPFKESYFLAGCKDGSVRLHTSNIETALLTLKNGRDSVGVRNIQWSKSKPMLIYVLDEYSRIVVWNLSSDDVDPTHAVSTKSWDNVRCIKLSPCNTNRDMQNQYLALGTDRGNVEVHKLKKNFHYSQQDDFLQDINKFLEYVSVL